MSTRTKRMLAVIAACIATGAAVIALKSGSPFRCERDAPELKAARFRSGQREAGFAVTMPTEVTATQPFALTITVRAGTGSEGVVFWQRKDGDAFRTIGSTRSMYGSEKAAPQFVAYPVDCNRMGLAYSTGPREGANLLMTRGPGRGTFRVVVPMTTAAGRVIYLAETVRLK
jgi:hypothetical protein